MSKFDQVNEHADNEPNARQTRQNPLAQYQRQLVYDTMQPYLEMSRLILDVGCGPGLDFEYYKKFPNLQLFAIDASESVMQQAISRAFALDLSIHVQATSLEKFKTRHKFDIIYMNFGVMNSFDNIYLAARKLDELLEEDGHIFAVVRPPFHLFSGLGQLLGLRPDSFFKRVIKHRCVDAEGKDVFYYNQAELGRYFKVIRRVNLGALLPNVAQYQSSDMCRSLYGSLQGLEKKVGQTLPTLLGGEYVCYILKRLQ